MRTLLARVAALALIAGPLAGQAATRVTEAGFQPGDEILLEVEGDTLFSHTFTVGQGPALTLPVIGAIPLAAVRRAQVETFLAQQLGRYMKNPVVHAKALVRLSVLGELLHPGFYAVPAQAVLSDALMAAGGLTPEANFTAAHIDRESGRVWGGGDLQDAVARGLTIDGMGLRTGDRIVVPRRRDSEATFRILGVLATIPVAIFGIAQLLK